MSCQNEDPVRYRVTDPNGKDTWIDVLYECQVKEYEEDGYTLEKL